MFSSRSLLIHRVEPDAAAFRADFVRVVARIGINAHQAASLVRLTCGRDFETCGPEDLVPMLALLAALAAHFRLTFFIAGSCSWEN
jgi:hypothetical protein